MVISELCFGFCTEKKKKPNFKQNLPNIMSKSSKDTTLATLTHQYNTCKRQLKEAVEKKGELEQTVRTNTALINVLKKQVKQLQNSNGYISRRESSVKQELNRKKFECIKLKSKLNNLSMLPSLIPKLNELIQLETGRLDVEHQKRLVAYITN